MRYVLRVLRKTTYHGSAVMRFKRTHWYPCIILSQIRQLGRKIQKHRDIGEKNEKNKTGVGGSV